MPNFTYGGLKWMSLIIYKDFLSWYNVEVYSETRTSLNLMRTRASRAPKEGSHLISCIKMNSTNVMHYKSLKQNNYS